MLPQRGVLTTVPKYASYSYSSTQSLSFALFRVDPKWELSTLFLALWSLLSFFSMHDILSPSERIFSNSLFIVQITSKHTRSSSKWMFLISTEGRLTSEYHPLILDRSKIESLWETLAIPSMIKLKQRNYNES